MRALYSASAWGAAAVTATSINARGGGFTNGYWFNGNPGTATPAFAATYLTFTPGTNGILIVTCTGEGGNLTASATYNGVAMTQVPGASSANSFCFMFYTLGTAAPTSGIVVTLSAQPVRSALGAIYATGVDQVNPLEASTITNAGTSSPITVGPINYSAGSLIVDCAADQNSSWNASGIPGDTQILNPPGSGSGATVSYIANALSGSASATWTDIASGANETALIASFRQVAFTGTNPTISSIFPTTAGAASGTTITVNGTGFLNNPAPTVIVTTPSGTGNTVNANNVIVNSNTQITFTMPKPNFASFAGGPADITVINNDTGLVTLLGTSAAPQGFSYSAPVEQVINVDTGYRGNPTVMVNTEIAGVIARAGWTSVGDPNNQVTVGTLNNVPDETGAATTASVSWSTQDNWRNDTGSNTPGDQHMMYGFFVSGNLGGGPLTMAFNNLPASYATKPYNVYVYVGNHYDSSADYTLTIPSTGTPTTTLTVRSHETDSGFANNGFVFRKSNGTSGGTYTTSASPGITNGLTGDYILFTNLLGTSFNINVPGFDTDTRAGIAGIQIVQPNITNTPIAASGWNTDVIFEDSAAPSASQFAAGADTSALFEARQGDFADGLPRGGGFISENDLSTQYQLQPYTGLNCLLLPAGGSGSLTLTTPGKINTLRILAASTGASATTRGTFTFHFTDGTSSTAQSFNSFDWGDTGASSGRPANAAVSRMGRSTTAGTTFTYAHVTDYNLWETLLAPNTTKLVDRIDFIAATGIGNTGIFAISGNVIPGGTVATVSPNSGPVAGGQTVTITGSGIQSGATVQFGTAVAVVTNVDPVGQTITVTTPASVPANATGLFNVSFKNPDGSGATLVGGYTYIAAAAPTVGSLSPDSGPFNATTVVTITGTGFSPNIGTNGGKVFVDGKAAANITFINSTTITAVFPARTNTNSTVSVIVTNPDGQSGTLLNGFTYVELVIFNPFNVHTIGTGNGTATTQLTFYNPSQTITLTTPKNTGAAIYYTLDGSVPTFPTSNNPSTLTYTAPFTLTTLTAKTTVNAISVFHTTVGPAQGFLYSPYLPASASPVALQTGQMNYLYNAVTGLVPFNTNQGTVITPTPAVTASGIVTAVSPDVLTDGTQDRTAAFAAGTTQPAAGLIGEGTLLNARPSTTGNSNGSNNLPANAFQARFTGFITISANGIYTFATATDDGSQLYIDPVSVTAPDAAHLVVANNAGQGITTRSGQIGLLAGQHTIVVDYANTGGGFALGVLWDPLGGQNLVNIPNANLGVIGAIATAVSRPTGTYGGNLLRPVTITATTTPAGGNTVITYTIDGSDPDPLINPNAITYTGPISNITGNVTLTYMAKAVGYANSAKNSATYTVAAPIVTSVSPNSGPPANVVTHVTITGKNFSLPGGQANVTIGSPGTAPNANNIVFVSDTQITCDVPIPYDPNLGALPAVATVTVTNNNGDPGSNSTAFTYTGPPTIDNISPDNGGTLGQYFVTVTGTNFVSGSSVTVGNIPVPQANVTVNSNTQLQFIVPPSTTAGPVDVKVTVPDGRVALLSASTNQLVAHAFTYTFSPAPSVTSVVQPALGPKSGGTSITVNGTNFAPGATIQLNGITIANPTVNPNSVVFNSPPSAIVGTVPFTITNPDGQSASFQFAFTYLPSQPVISVNFESVNNGANSTNPILPSEFAGGVSRSNWNNCGAATGNGQPLTDDSGATIPGCSLTWIGHTTYFNGNGDTTPNGRLMSGYLDDGYTGPQPSSASFNGIPFTRYDVYVYSHGDAQNGNPQGSYFVDTTIHTAADPNHVNGGRDLLNKSPFNSSALTEAVGNGSSGDYLVFRNVTLANPIVSAYELVPGNERCPLNGVQIVSTAPLSAGVIPNSGPANTTTNVTIVGVGFLTNPTVLIGTTQATAVQFLDSNRITCTVPALAAGSYNIKVTNTDGSFTAPFATFTYVGQSPTISSITPTTGGTVGGDNFEIVGTNFIAPLTVKFGNVLVANPVVGTNQASGNPNITGKVPPAAAAGAVVVTVTNNDLETVTTPYTYTLSPAPSGLTITPKAGPQNVNANVVINGSNFVTAGGSPPGSLVTVAGAAAVSTTVGGPTSLNATLPGQAAYQKTIVVTNPVTLTATLVYGFTFIATRTFNPYTPTTGTGPLFHYFDPAGITVSLATTAPAGAKIYYTLDGSVPGTSVGGSTFLWDPANPPAQIPVNAKATINALVTYLDGVSAVATANYTPLIPAVNNAALTTATLNFTYYETAGPNAGTFPAGLTVGGTGTETSQSSSPLCGIGSQAQNADHGMLISNVPAISAGLNNVYGPAEGIINIAARYTGFVNCPVTGVYTFDTRSDDGSRLYIDGIQVVSNNFGGGQGATDQFGQIGLFAGNHAITIDYNEGNGGYEISVKWQTPAGGPNPGALAIIPDAYIGIIPPPVISSVNPPNNATSNAGNSIVVTGLNFQTGATVTVGGVALTNVTYNLTNPSSETITGTIPTNVINANTVLLVTNPDTGFASIPYSIYRGPDIPNTFPNMTNQIAYKFFGGGNSLLPGSVNGGDPTLVTAMDTLTPTSSGRYTGGTFAPNAICYGPTNATQANNFLGNLMTGLTGSNQNFYAKFTAFLQIDTDGLYTFTTSSDDGSALFIGGQQVVNNNFAQGITDRSGTGIAPASRTARDDRPVRAGHRRVWRFRTVFRAERGPAIHSRRQSVPLRADAESIHRRQHQRGAAQFDLPKCRRRTHVDHEYQCGRHGLHRRFDPSHRRGLLCRH